MEATVATSYYRMTEDQTIGMSWRPPYNALFKAFREAPYGPLLELDRWKPVREEIASHALAGRPGEPTINWPKSLHSLHGCNFALAKYKQLVYMITTDSLPNGSKIHHFSSRGRCPHCGVIATSLHIFKHCPVTQAFIALVDEKGGLHWPDYQVYDYNEIPTLLNSYNAQAMYQLSALWAMWRLWSSYFHDKEFDLLDQAYLEDKWVKQMGSYMHLEFIKRIYELASDRQSHSG